MEQLEIGAAENMIAGPRIISTVDFETITPRFDLFRITVHLIDPIVRRWSSCPSSVSLSPINPHRVPPSAAMAMRFVIVETAAKCTVTVIPHWDVQGPGGGHVNIYPSGRSR